MSTLQRLTDRGSIKPPRWLPANVQYETIMGSVAYGIHSMRTELEAAHRASRLAEVPTAGPALNDLLIRLRIGG
jgi:hypothetical protein